MQKVPERGHCQPFQSTVHSHTVHNQRNTHIRQSEKDICQYLRNKMGCCIIYFLNKVESCTLCTVLLCKVRRAPYCPDIYFHISISIPLHTRYFTGLHTRYFTGRKPQDFRHYPVDFHSKLRRLSTGNKHDKNCIELGGSHRISGIIL